MFENSIKKSLFFFILIILVILTAGIVSANESINDTAILIENSNMLTSDNEISADSLENIAGNIISEESYDDEVHSSHIDLSKQSITAKSKSTVSLTISVKDENSNTLNMGFVSIDVDGKTYESDVIDGKAKLTFKMPNSLGTCNYKINYYSLSPNIEDSSKTIVLTSKMGTKVIVKSVTGYQGKKVKLVATLKTDDNKPIKGVYLKFKFNGKTHSTKTDSKGKAFITVKYPKAKFFKTVKKTKRNILTKTTYYQKTYDCNVSFDGKGNYLKSSSVLKVTSKKKPIVKKYRKYNYKYITVPLKYDVHTYKKGSIMVGTIKQKDVYSDNIGVAAVVSKTKEPIKISARLHYKDPAGKWHWDSNWEPYDYYDGIPIVTWEHSRNFPPNKVQIRYYSPHYKLIK